MPTTSPHSFLVSLPDPPSIKSYIGRSIVFIIISISTLVAAYYENDSDNKYYQLIVLRHPALFWGIISTIFAGALIYTIYEQSKHKVWISFDKNKILVTHRYNKSLKNQFEISKSAISNITLEVKNVGSQKNENRRIFLLVSVEGMGLHIFEVPLSRAAALLASAKETGYPISSSVEQTLKTEQQNRNFDKFARRLTIIALAFIPLFGIFMLILYFYLGGKSFH